jgi:hypothetical protein
VFAGYPDTNYDAVTTLGVELDDNGDEAHTLVQFDLSALPGDAEVISATLELYALFTTQPSYDIQTNAILGSWDETTVTWSNMPNAEPAGDPPSTILGASGWYGWDVTNVVDGWVSGSLTDHGILLHGGDTVGERRFYALPDSNAARLTVAFTSDTCPEPLTGVSISGPLTATTGVSTTLTAVVSPAGAALPITYTWAPAPALGQGTEQARHLWYQAGQHTIMVTATNCGGAFTAAHTVGVNAVRLLDIPADLHRRAARHLEEVRGTDAAPGWDMAQLGSLVRPLYRPDVEGVAYYEFPVVIPPNDQLTGLDAGSTGDQPVGYIILSTGEHDYPIAHWASAGKPLTQELEQRAADADETAVTFYKLDTLAYAAENENGERVATIGTQPLKITGMDPAWLDDPPEPTQSEWTPTLALTDDLGADQITGTLVVTGPTPPPALQFSAWESWDAMKAGYSDSYGILAEVTRRNASESWDAESAIRQYGQPLFKGETYILPLLWHTPTVSLSGEGVGYVQTEVLTRTGLPPVFEITVLDSSLGQAIPLTATVNYQNDVEETIGFVIVEPYSVFLPSMARDADSMMSLGSVQQPVGGQAVGRIQAGPWHHSYAGTSADQCWYTQIPEGESPNTSACTSGCGATAWAMLFCWVDNQAVPESGNEYWQGRWGLYRLGSIDDVAPKEWGDIGPKEMTWEIRNDIDTWCWGEDAPTLPADMNGVRSYVSGRSTTRVSTEYSNVGIGWDSIMKYARNGIARSDREKATPVIIGTGWLSHYPLAYGYRRRSHTYCLIPDWRVGCVTTHEHQFLVNQGWSQGHGEWVAGDIWYAGRVFPRSAWNDDVGLYYPYGRRWYFDYDHDGVRGATDEYLKYFGSSDALPIAGDFCRDNVLGDIAFFRPSRTSWTFDCGHNGSINEWIEWGYSDGRPVALDVDRDGFVDDIALFRTSGEWSISRDYVDYTTSFIGSWGLSGDLPIAGDFDRDGYADDLGLYRPSTRMWYYDHNHDGDTDAISGPWGFSGDLPVVGDFDKDGFMDDVAVFRPSTGMWYYDHNHNGSTNETSGPWGWSGLLPIAGNFETK